MDVWPAACVTSKPNCRPRMSDLAEAAAGGPSRRRPGAVRAQCLRPRRGASPLPAAHPRARRRISAVASRWRWTSARCAASKRHRRRGLPPQRLRQAASPAVVEPFRGNLDSHYTFDNFVEGRSNQLGRAAAWQAAQKPGERAHNPLLLYGGTGLGKTHLMFAAGNEMRRNNPGSADPVPALRTVLQRLHQAPCRRRPRPVQAPVPADRRAADRRHPVLRRQGPHPGRVLPHLQRAVRRPPADHPHLRPLPARGRRPGTAAEVAAGLGPVGGDRPAGLRDPRRRSCCPRRASAARWCRTTSPT